MATEKKGHVHVNANPTNLPSQLVVLIFYCVLFWRHLQLISYLFDPLLREHLNMHFLVAPKLQVMTNLEDLEVKCQGFVPHQLPYSGPLLTTSSQIQVSCSRSFAVQALKPYVPGLRKSRQVKKHWRTTYLKVKVHGQPSPKGGLIQGLYKPIYGTSTCAVYSYSGV